jgi:hypothetical protein
MSNNPDNNDLISVSSDSVSQESTGNCHINQLSDEDVSSYVQSNGDLGSVSGDSSSLSQSNGDLGSVSDDSSNLDVSGSNVESEFEEDVSSFTNNLKTGENSNSKSLSSSSSNSELTASASSSNLSAVNTAKSSSKNVSSTAKSSTVSTNTKRTTALSISNKTVHSGTRLVITLKNQYGVPLQNKKVVLNITGLDKVYTKTTNSKGKVTLVVSPVGTHKAVFSFAGDKNNKASKLETNIRVLKSDIAIEVKNRTVCTTSDLVITLRNNKSGNLLAKTKVTIKIPAWNKTFTKITDSKGEVKIPVNTTEKFNIFVGFAGNRYFNKTSYRTSITPIKCGTKLSYFNRIKYGKYFVLTLRSGVDNSPVAGKKVIVRFVNSNKTYIKKTNANGKFAVPVNSTGRFNVRIRFIGDDSFETSFKEGKFIVNKGVVSIAAPKEVGQGDKYVITLKNSAGDILPGKKVLINVNGKTYTRITNSKGKAGLSINLKKGHYSFKIRFVGNRFYNPAAARKTLKVGDPRVSISKIITAAKDLKTRAEYINILNKSYSVTIDNKKYTLDEFSYLMAGAINNLRHGSKASVKIKDLSNNYKSNGAKINGKLSKSDYLSLASYLTKYVDSRDRIPNFRTTKLGKMEADLYIYAFTSILDSYSKNNKLPSSVKVNTKNVRGGYSASISQGGKILNYREIFDSTSFKKYLKMEGTSAVNDAIKSKAKSLTKGLTSPLAKAIVIFRYVRDEVTYSFYSNSLKGAKKTFSSKSGNCCDKANLIVAMCRSVGVYAR